MGQPAQFGTHKAKLSLSNIIYSQQKCDKPVLPCPPPSGSPGLVSEVINTLMAGMGGMPPLDNFQFQIPKLSFLQTVFSGYLKRREITIVAKTSRSLGSSQV